MPRAPRKAYWALATILAVVAAPPAYPESLPPPAGRVILTVSGALSRTNDEAGARFDRAMLEALPQHTLLTETPWTDGITRFEGPLARNVLAAVGASGESVRASAINDYAVNIPLADFEQYDVIVALTRDGAPMRVRDKGPLWIIYPWSDHPQLRSEVHHSRSIWQLKALHVE